MASDEDQDFESDPEEIVEEEEEEVMVVVPGEKAQGEVKPKEKVEGEEEVVEKDKVENLEEKEGRGMEKEVEFEEEMEDKEDEEEQMEIDEEEEEVEDGAEEEEEAEVEDEVKEEGSKEGQDQRIQVKDGAGARDKKESAEETQDHGDEGRRAEGNSSGNKAISEVNKRTMRIFAPDKHILCSENSGVAKHVVSVRRAEPFAEMEACTTASKDACNDDSETHRVHQSQLNSGGPVNVNTATSLDACDNRLATKNVIEGGPKSKIHTGPVEDESSSLQPQEKIFPSSVFLPQRRPRSPSPDAVLENARKQGIICSFFAKGWCIKGKNCRYLHQKVGVESSNQVAQDNLPWPSGTGDFQHKKGLRQESELLKPQASQEAQHSPNIEGSSDCQFLAQRALIRKYGGKGSEQDNSLGPSDDSNELLKEKFAAGGQALNPPLDDLWLKDPSYRTSPMTRSTLISENRFLSSGPSTFSSLHQHRSSDFAYDRMTVNCARHNHWRDFPHHDSVTSYGLNSSLDGSFTGPLPPACILPPVQFKADAWETSVPFRSKVCPLPSRVSPPRNHYNPLLDRLDDPTVGSTNSQSSQRASILSFSGQNLKNELMATGLQDPANNTQNPGNCFRQHHEDVAAKDASANESSGYAAPTSAQEPNNIDGRSSCTRTEEKLQVSNHAPADGNAVEMGTSNTANEPEQEVTHNDPRMKSFRAALVEFVKELVKPAWREGYLTKDAHKIVVKKSVEKVLGTLQLHQIPITQDDLKHFLSISHQKLERLVNAYVDRYKRFPG